jgi:dipeptidyl-peptidase-4
MAIIRSASARRTAVCARVPAIVRALTTSMLAVLSLAPNAARAQGPATQQATPQATPLATLDQLLAMSRTSSGELNAPQWLGPDAYTVLEESANGSGTDIVRYDAATGNRTVLVAATKLIVAGQSIPIAIEAYQWSADASHVLLFTHSQPVWRQHTRGDYWIYEPSTGALRQLGAGSPASSLMFATFSPDGRRVAYVRANNIFVEELAGGHPIQLTSDGSPTIINGTFDWVYEEELNLRNGLRWSPDGRRIAFWQLDASGVRDYDLMNDTDSLYSFVKPVQYPKAGETNSAARIGVVRADGGPTQWLHIPGDPRNHYLTHLEWVPNDSVALTVQQMDRAQQRNTLFQADVSTGAVRTIVTERDSAWVEPADLTWLDGGKSFIWISERDGWRRAYVFSRDGTTSRLLTPGAYEIAEPDIGSGPPLIQSVDSAHGRFYFYASPDDATRLYLYRGYLDGRPAERLTPAGESGLHRYQISPGGRWAIDKWSTFDTPPVTELVQLPSHRTVRTLADNAQLRASLAGLNRPGVEFTRLGAANGVQFDAWIMTPPHFDPSKQYPVLFFVYGGPAEQTVLDSWNAYYYLFHAGLAQQGYIIASIDNRGTPASRGSAFRKAIYKHLGEVDVQDQIDAARALLRRPYADATRVGIWGWSGGGTMTLNLLFRAPDLYRMGMAVAPVSDQRFYDTIYTERYLGLPQDDSSAYRRASPLTYVDGLRGSLLLVHGSGDDNVHYQNSEMVVNALVAADKPFDLMVYPNRTHCICEGQNTSRHLIELLTRYTLEHLPSGGRAAVHG